MSYRNLQARSIDDYEIINQCGSGTYGFVFKAIHRQTRNIVALKKVSQFPVEDGNTPVEIKYLSQLCTSRNIIKLKDYFFTREGELALVFEYMETDLWRLISGPSACLPLFQVKCIMKQLFEGLHQCHSAGIMHRDIKPSNLLISSSGTLKLADFGLTTSYIAPPHLSNNVVSLYYRPPELLMGSRSYGPEIDVWSAGCILVELLTNNYLFAGANEAEQLDMIFKVFGTPSEEIWPGVTQLPGWGLVESAAFQHPLRNLRDNFSFLDYNVLDLATRLLALDPKLRISSYEALQHPWFWTTPLPSHPTYVPLFIFICRFLYSYSFVE
jgi:serine/threonine protein kinase